jgi:hypothetical protein
LPVPGVLVVQGGHLGPDDLVLLTLDRGDDVAEPARPGGLECGQQGAMTGDGRTVVVGSEPEAGDGVAEQLVLDVEQHPTTGREMAAAHETHGLAAGRPVERLGHRSPPVDDDRVLDLVAHRDPPDVIGRRLVGLVDPAEAQRGIAQLELREALEHGVPDDVALEPGLLGAAPPDLDHRGHATGRLAGCLEIRVGPIDVGLFRLEIGMTGHGLLA